MERKEGADALALARDRAARANADTKAGHLRKVEAAVTEFYAAAAPQYGKWLSRERYYYARQIKILRHVLPMPGRVLEVGCGLGQNLAGLNPEYGLGIDCCGPMLDEARKRYPAADYPHLEFRQMSAFDCDQLGMHFDTVILINSLTEIPDPVLFFKRLRNVCTPRTRVFQMSYNYLWEPILKFGAAVRLCQRRPVQNWFSKVDYLNMFRLAGYEIVRDGADLLLPKKLPLLSDFVNRFASLVPVLHTFCMLYYSVARPLGLNGERNRYVTTVVVPCKNEEASVPGIVERIPDMGAATEIVFVDDASTDGTAKAIEDEIRRRPGRDIKSVAGPGQGKGAAVRAGFAAARGDIFAILDADLTVLPDALPEFVEALVSGKGEFINGSRLVYPMDGAAMRTLNIFGNKVFALLFSVLLSQRVKDTLCGTKAVWRADYARLLETRDYLGRVDRWGDYDWLLGAARHNLQIVELPVHYRERKTGDSKMTKRLRNAWVMLKMCHRAFWKLKLI